MAKKKVSSAKKTSELPTKIYSYYLHWPSINAEQKKIIDNELYKANKFRNALVRIERSKRAKIRKIIKSLSPDLSKLESEYNDLSKARKDIIINELSGVEKKDRNQEVLEKLRKIKEEQKIISNKIKTERNNVIKNYIEPLNIKFNEALSFELLKIVAEKGISEAKELLNGKPENLSEKEYKSAIKKITDTKNLGPNNPLRHKAREKITKEFLDSGSRAWNIYRKSIDHANKRSKIVKKNIKISSGTASWVIKAAEASFKTTIFNPKFVKFDHTGCVGIQLVKSSADPSVKGLTVDRLFSGKDARLKLEKMPNIHLHKKRLACMMRMKLEGTKKNGTYIDGSIALHRPLPEDAIIKWAYIKIDKIGHRTVCELQLTVESATFLQQSNVKKKDKVSINFGWRVLENGDIRVATIWDGEKSSYVELSHKMRVKNKKATDIISVNEKLFNEAKSTLNNFIKTNKINSDLFNKLKLDTLSHWKSHNRLIFTASAFKDEYLKNINVNNLWIKWREFRQGKKPNNKTWSEWRKSDKYKSGPEHDLFCSFEYLSKWLSDQDIKDEYEKISLYLEWWSRKNIHLDNMSKALINKIKLHRREIYRIHAAKLASKYENVIIEKWNKSKTAELPDIEDDNRTPQEEKANSLRQFCGVSVFTQSLKYSFGSKSEEKDPTNISTVHFGCGGKVNDVKKGYMVKCNLCNKFFDQDVNAARNLFQMSQNARG